MKKINLYLFSLTNRYLLINFIIISMFIIFINLLELSELFLKMKKVYLILYIYLLKYPSILNEIVPFVLIISVSFFN